jgi:hypothetical protein
MRWPFIARLDHTAPGAAKSGQPHRGAAEKRPDLMLAVVFHATNTATDSATRPANGSVLPGLSGNELLLQTRQHRFSLGHRQPQIGDVTEIARADDLRDVDPLLLTIGPDCYQPDNSRHASAPIKTSRRVIPLPEHTPNHETAPAAVAADNLLVVATDVVQAPNDKQQLEPMLGKLAGLPEELGKVGDLLADNGYFSEGNVNACTAAGIEPVIAMGREAHHPSLAERFAEDPEPPKDPTPVEAMRHRLQTKEGKKRYALRKQTPEPVFGIIKSVLGFRQFLLRGLDNVRGEWKLVTMAWNMKRMFALAGAV